MAESAVSFLEHIGFRLSQPLLRLVAAQDIPERLVIKPDCPWPGSAARGLYMIDAMKDENLNPRDWPKNWHDFSFLRDLEAAGGYPARKAAQYAVFSYIHHSGRMPPCDPMLGARLYQWIMYADLVLPEFDEDAQDIFFEHLVSKGYVLVRALKKNSFIGIEKLHAAAGLICAGFGFEGYEDWAELGITTLKHEIDVQILNDGGHISRSPENTFKALVTFLDIRTTLVAAGYPVPPEVNEAINKTAQAVRFFRYHDKGFALFNGTQEGDKAYVDCVLRQAGVHGKAPKSLPDSGFEKAVQDRTMIMMCAGIVPPTGYDREVHGAPLVFEMCYGRERMFVSCGTHPSDDEWRRMMRVSAAHCTATLEDQSAYSIGEQGGLERYAQDTTLTRLDDKKAGAVLLEGHHDGYKRLNGFTHTRRIYMGGGGHDIRGEDRFTAKKNPLKPVDAAVRFHIHPRVMVSLVRDGQEALLRMPGGIGWRFSHAGGALSIEDSVYLGQGEEPRKTGQLVIRGTINGREAVLRWGIKREG